MAANKKRPVKSKPKSTARAAKTSTKTSVKALSKQPAKKTRPVAPSAPVAPRTTKQKLRRLAKFVAIPLLVYFVFFCFYTWPWAIHFNTRFFTDTGDGFQNVWNIWWVNKSVTQLHQLPWHTMMLHYPYGTTLLGQTLNPFNGFVAIPLLTFLSLAQAYNVMVIFSFLVGGLTAFWLCYYLARSYIPAIIGGFIFTFSSYHMAHAIGHMQLVSLEWIPLFILLWWKLLVRPRYRYAVGAAVVLLLILLCDYYYFIYSLGAAALIFGYLWYRKDFSIPKLKQNYRPAIVFILLFLILCAPLPVALLRYNARDMLDGSHPARVFSTDLLAPLIDGGFWRFAALTTAYWHHIKAFTSESSIYLSLAVVTLAVIAIWKRNKLHRDTVFWIIFCLIFGIFSLGPRLMVRGHSFERIPMPYAVLEHIVPPLKLAGTPVRMMIMVTLGVAVLSAIVLSHLNLKARKGQLLLALFCLVLVIELWPATMPNTPIARPKYVEALKALPAGAVLDNGAISSSWQLYDQTIAEKPMALGYISRTPVSVEAKDLGLIIAMDNKQYDKLCSEHAIRYLTTPAFRHLPDEYASKAVYKDGYTIIYDLKNSPGC